MRSASDVCAFCRTNEAATENACNSCIAAYRSGALKTHTGTWIGADHGVTASEWLSHEKEGTPMTTSKTSKSSNGKTSNDKTSNGKATASTPKTAPKVQPTSAPVPTASRKPVTRERGNVPATVTPSKSQVKRQRPARHTDGNGGTSRATAVEASAPATKHTARSVRGSADTDIVGTLDTIIDGVASGELSPRALAAKLAALRQQAEVLAALASTGLTPTERDDLTAQAYAQALADAQAAIAGLSSNGSPVPTPSQTGPKTAKSAAPVPASTRKAPTPSRATNHRSAAASVRPARVGSYLDAALAVLGKSRHPLTVREITDRAIETGLIDVDGAKTPELSMGARIYTAYKSGRAPLEKVAEPGNPVRWARA